MNLPPLLLIAFTVAAYLAGNALYLRSGKLAICHPVLIAMLITIALLVGFDVKYQAYFAENRILHLLLGPCVVALAVPISEHLARARRALPLVVVCVLLCGTLIVLTTTAAAFLAGLDLEAVKALITRSVTAPVALAIGARVGSNASLIMLAVFLTGVIGVVCAPLIFAWLNIRDDAVKGLVLGLTAHTFGIARALEISTEAAAFATLGMGLMACIAAILIPFIVAACM